MCGERFLGPAVVGFHRWYAGSLRRGYKQKLCPKCAKTHFGSSQPYAVDTEQEEPQYPNTCYACQAELDGQAAETWTTWFKGKTKRNVVLITCEHCAGNVRTVMMLNAEVLEDRQPSGVGAGGAPLPNPPGFGKRDALPW